MAVDPEGRLVSRFNSSTLWMYNYPGSIVVASLGRQTDPWVGGYDIKHNDINDKSPGPEEIEYRSTRETDSYYNDDYYEENIDLDDEDSSTYDQRWSGDDEARVINNYEEDLESGHTECTCLTSNVSCYGLTAVVTIVVVVCSRCCLHL